MWKLNLKQAMVDFGDFQRDRASQIASHSVQLTTGNERLNKLPGAGVNRSLPCGGLGGVITITYNNLKVYIYNKQIALHFV